ncbi:patatin-like phospholipase domain-containing protein 4 isoform X6 [Globicephala melas]|uniref:patatin-like phospholipase domain-containing protein 4 isoform X6 n=1 Tax=Globicephala melas TaxID=9731 RepID=UPI00293D2C02|nr:patatin-like phospholipase domain-containing protein 4 isoform X6 [Globicephala melas]
MTGWDWRGTKFYTEMPQTCIARMKHINLSFAACGFLGIYHLGAASALYKHGQKLLKNVKAFAGASAGSLVASVLLTAPQKIEVLLASSFVPIYAGLKPVEYKGQKWVDGCFTNSLPLLPVGRTVTVSAFSGRVDISPQDEGQLDFYVTIAKQHILYVGLSLLWPLPLRSTGSAAMAHGPSRSAACGILLDRGTNPCPLHRQVDSQPLCQQGSPEDNLLIRMLNFCVNRYFSWSWLISE